MVKFLKFKPNGKFKGKGPNGKFKPKGQNFEIQTQVKFLLYKYDHFLSNFHQLLQNYFFHSVFVLS